MYVFVSDQNALVIERLYFVSQGGGLGGGGGASSFQIFQDRLLSNYTLTLLLTREGFLVIRLLAATLELLKLWILNFATSCFYYFPHSGRLFCKIDIQEGYCGHFSNERSPKLQTFMNPFLTLFSMGGIMPPFRFFLCCIKMVCSRVMKFRTFSIYLIGHLKM